MAEGSVTVGELVDWARRFAGLVTAQRSHLTELDAAIGDGDHGTNMDRGLRVVCEKLDAGPPATAGEVFKLVGTTLVSNVGGASGPLYGTFFLRLGALCGAGEAVSAPALAAALRAGVEGVVARGRAEPGDKTMLDSLQPAVEVFETAVAGGQPLAVAFGRARDAAVAGRDATIGMVAHKGRASYLGERSLGHQDAGATSATLLFEAAALVFGAQPGEGRPAEGVGGRGRVKSVDR